MTQRDRIVCDADDARGQPGRILGTGLADGDCGHRYAGRHLNDRVEGVDTAEVLGRHRNADHRKICPRGDDARKMAAPPAAAMTTLSPRSRADDAHSMTPRGLRCAEQTFSSCVNSSSSSTLTHDSMSGRSDLEPRMMPTTGCTK